ncbi:MAG TPA: ATP-binding protein [Candidatus Wallbacteria bacterium]|nr:ATP-binding protein [Candidatus Wallbacteria bacterium]
MNDFNGRDEGKNILADNEVKYRLLFENPITGFAYHRIIVDASGMPVDYVFLELNDTFEYFTGLKRGDIIGKKATEIFDMSDEIIRDSVEGFIKKYGEVALEGGSERLEKYSPADKKWYDVYVYSPLCGYFATVLLDITARKQAENELLKSSRFLLSSINSIESPIAIIDDIGTIVHTNIAWNSMKDKSPFFGPEFAQDLNFLESCSAFTLQKTKNAPDILNGIFAVIAGSLKQYHDEYYYKGSWFGIRVTSFEADGIKTVIIHENITDRKKNEEYMTLNESRLETLLKMNNMTEAPVDRILEFALEEALCLTGSKTGVIALLDENEKPVNVKGTPGHFWARCETADKTPCLDIEENAWYLGVLKKRKTVMSNDYPENGNGAGRFISVPVFDDERIAAIFAVSDKTCEYDHFEQNQLELLVIEIWRLVKRKSAEQVLREANEKLKKLDVLKTDFLSMVSHELRTPLTSIIGFTNIIKKKLDSIAAPLISENMPKRKKAFEQITGNIDIILSEGERLAELINNVLDITKLESGKTEWKMQEVFAAEVIDKAVGATNSLILAKGLGVHVDIEKDIPPVTGDFNKLLQVVINLISNAVKFSDKGGITCRARLEEGYAVISVEDNGIGIWPENLSKIFEKFKQLSDTLPSKYVRSGTGLGLPICRQIVEYHEGRIWVESEPGKGSIFSFSIPVRSRSAIDKSEISRRLFAQLSEQVLETVLPVGQNKVLIIEEDEKIRRAFRPALEEHGFKIIEANDGIDAIAKIKIEKQRPDLILINISINKMAGFDFALILRSDPLISGVPIVILSVKDKSEGNVKFYDIDRFFIC